MGGLLAQEFKLMRREIDHEQFATRLEDTRSFGDGRGGIIEEVQHLMQVTASAAPSASGTL